MNDGWIEISLEVDGELAEAVAELLSRYIPLGIVIERKTAAGPGLPAGPAGDQVRVYGYIPQDGQAQETRQRIEEGLWYLGRISPLPQPSYNSVKDEDWSQSWKENFQPLRVGKKLTILPSWIELSAAEVGRVPIAIDPGMAFGTGTHPSTSLALELLEDEVRQGYPVIDVGCGSGILAIAALKLGASRALGVDIDPQAAREASKNARINQVIERLELGNGSIAEIRAGAYSLRRAPVVVANIVAPILLKMIQEGLGELLAEGGVLILSGLMLEQEGEVTRAAEAAGLSVRQRRQAGDWAALAFSAVKS
jgi:ribosomal protein L11 methyltransferase